MAGDERKRFCGDCKMNVYNLSGMTRYDAENLLKNAEGRLCVRYFQRADGTILTKDCPVGWAKVKGRMTAFATAMFALFVTIMGGVALFAMFGKKSGVVMGEIPVNVGRKMPKEIGAPNDNTATMGAIAMPVNEPKIEKKTLELMGEVRINK
jgi:hypothetical protein